MLKVLTIFLLFTSCSLYKSEDYPSFSNFEKKNKEDYIDHLENLGRTYLESPETKVFPLSTNSLTYINSIYNKLLKNNEILLDKKIKLRFYVIQSEIPFHFSLPKGQVFFSTELLKIFFESENLFICAFSYEIVKTHRNIYLKNMTIPKGYIELPKLLTLTKVPFESKIEIDKWAYLSMKRAGYDDSAYLIWLKIQNKNSFDLAELLRGRNISKEEFVFKNFLVKELNEGNNIEMEGASNSSQGYYNFLLELRKKTI